MSSPERKSGNEGVVGGDPILQESLKAHISKLFTEALPWKHESDQSPEFRKIVEAVSAHMGEFVEKYGGTPLPINPEHVHLFDRRSVPPGYLERGLQLEEGYMVLGAYLPDMQGIAILFESDTKDAMITATLLAHEMIHFSAFQSLTIQNSEEVRTREVKTRRSGLLMRSKHGTNLTFRGINEAVTEELAQRFVNTYIGALPGAQESIAQNLLENLSRTENPAEIMALLETIKQIASSGSMDAETVSQIEKVGEQLMHKVEEAGLARALIEAPVTHYTEENGYAVYELQRRNLKKLVRDIFEKNKDDYETEESVFEVFARAAIGGRVLPLARLIEKTYGRHTFREVLEDV